MFFYKVEGHMPKLSSFGRGKKFRLKSHLGACCMQPFIYVRLLLGELESFFLSMPVSLTEKSSLSDVIYSVTPKEDPVLKICVY